MPNEVHERDKRKIAALERIATALEDIAKNGVAIRNDSTPSGHIVDFFVTTASVQ